jgi:hypothetical protein
LRLCLKCAQVGRHELECPDQDDPDAHSTDPRTRQARAAVGLPRIREFLSEGERTGGSPRERLRLAWVAQQMLETYPATDFPGFDTRRSRNDLANAIAKVGDAATSQLAEGEGARLLEDLVFARRALELFAVVARRRHEAVAFDLSEFVEIPKSDRREVGDDLKVLCEEVEKGLAQSFGLEEVVAKWGPANVEALAAGTDPVVIPEEMLPPLQGKKTFVRGTLACVLGLGVAGFSLSPAVDQVVPFLPPGLGLPEAQLAGAVGGAVLALFGIVAAWLARKRIRESETARRDAPAEHVKSFHELSVQYRQRVYMSAALRVLRKKASLVVKAEDAFREFTTGDASPRWKRLCTSDSLDIVGTFFDWDGRQPLKDVVSHAVARALGANGRLRPFDEMATDGWIVLLKAFLLDLFAEDSGNEARYFDGLSLLIAEGAIEDHELEARAGQTMEAWNALLNS